MCMHEAYKMDSRPDPDGLGEMRQHIPIEITPAHIKAAEKILEGYIFKRREKDQYFGFCTKCGKDMPVPLKWKHNQKVKCPRCRQEVTCKDAWRGRKALKETIYLIYYRRSAIQKDTITAVGGLFTRDHSGDYKTNVTKCSPHDFYLFQPGKGGIKYGKHTSWYYSDEKFYLKRKCTTTTFPAGFSYYSILSYWNPTSLKSAIKSANLNHCMIMEIYEQLKSNGIGSVEIVDYCLKYPCMEYMYKTGQRKLIYEKFHHYNMNGLVNWKGKTAQKVFKLDGQQMKEVKINKIELTSSFLRFTKLIRTEGCKLSMKEIAEFETLHYYTDDLKEMSAKSGQTIVFILNYIKKQAKRTEAYKPHIKADLQDYWRQCDRLGVDLEEENNRFPTNLFEKHQEMTKRIKYVEDQPLNEKIKLRLKSLYKLYFFEYDGLIMRPAESSIELIDEGNALNHCVGGYAGSYASGNTDLCFIRRIEEPDKPFHTAEFRNGTLIQCRGYKNQTEEADRPIINAFLAAFKEKIEKKVRKAG